MVRLPVVTFVRGASRGVWSVPPAGRLTFQVLGWGCCLDSEGWLAAGSQHLARHRHYSCGNRFIHAGTSIRHSVFPRSGISRRDSSRSMRAPGSESITLEQLAALPWASYQRFYDALVNRQLSLLGIEPQVQVSVDSFQLLPVMVAGTRRVAMIQALLADRLGLGPGSGIRVLDCPFDAVPVQEALWWHPVHTHDAGHLWLRETAAVIAAQSAA